MRKHNQNRQARRKRKAKGHLANVAKSTIKPAPIADKSATNPEQAKPKQSKPEQLKPEKSKNNTKRDLKDSREVINDRKIIKPGKATAKTTPEITVEKTSAPALMTGANLLALGAIIFGVLCLVFSYFITRQVDTNIAQQLYNIEYANTAFFKKYQMWPTKANLGGSRPYAASVAVLKAVPALPGGAIYAQSLADKRLKDYLPALDYRADYFSVWHNLGAGGAVYELVVSNPGKLTGQYLVVEFSDIPIEIALKIDQVVDEVANPTGGRLFLTAGNNFSCFNKPELANDKTTGLVNLCYAANKID